MKSLVDIIIPTYNNPELLLSCVKSIRLSVHGPLDRLTKIIVVNNGSVDFSKYIPDEDWITILNPGSNLGWERGLEYGLNRSEAPIVVFCNDDIRIPTGQKNWLWRMLARFNDPEIGAVGPSSNFVMGKQSIFIDIAQPVLEVTYLIGFFFMVRREALIKSGGIDSSLPGGDDIDLSIRLRDQGYKLIADREAFIFHHGQMTGQKVMPGYWSSQAMQEKTNEAIIRKHGMLKFYDALVSCWNQENIYQGTKYAKDDIEGDICRSHVSGKKIAEMGCGSRHTIKDSIGVDILDKHSDVPFIWEQSPRCAADLVGDCSRDAIFDDGSMDTIIARHILEHCQDTMGTLSSWNRMLRFGGRLIIATPNNSIGNTILMNPDHVVSFVPSSLEKLANVCGFEKLFCEENCNGVSFVMVLEKNRPSYLKSPDFTNHSVGAKISVGAV